MIRSRLTEHERPLLLDGAMGTELHRRSVAIRLPLWSAHALLHAPDIVCDIHAEYIRCGADIITTNTFRTNVRTLERAGLSAQWETLNARAVELAREARNRTARPVLIAGSIAPVEDCYAPELVPPDAELRREHSEQAALLASLRVDLLLAETMTTVREAAIVAEACAKTGVEFAVSFHTKNDGALLSGESLVDAIRTVEAFDPSAIMINCVSARFIIVPLRIAFGATQLPVGCYANVGTPTADGVALQADVDVEGYAACAEAWIEAGARIVGGCCGTGPEYVRAIALRIELDAET